MRSTALFVLGSVLWLGLALTDAQATDMWISPMKAITPDGAAYPVKVVNTGGHKFLTLDYPLGGKYCAYFHVKLPLAYVNGTQITTRLFYMNKGSDTTNIDWTSSAKCFSAGDTYDGALSAGSLITDAPPGQNLIDYLPVADSFINETGCDPGDHLVFTICRESGSNISTMGIVRIGLLF